MYTSVRQLKGKQNTDYAIPQINAQSFVWWCLRRTPIMSKLFCIAYRRRIGTRFTLSGNISRCRRLSVTLTMKPQSLTDRATSVCGNNFLQCLNEYQLLISSLARVLANMIIAAGLHGISAKIWLVDKRDSTHQLTNAQKLLIMLALHGILDAPLIMPKAMPPY